MPFAQKFALFVFAFAFAFVVVDDDDCFFLLLLPIAIKKFGHMCAGFIVCNNLHRGLVVVVAEVVVEDDADADADEDCAHLWQISSISMTKYNKKSLRFCRTLVRSN
jgi:hypothetical protein